MRTEHLFLCGEVGEGVSPTTTSVPLQLGIRKGARDKPTLSLHRLNARMLSNQPPRLADLLDIAIYVHLGDLQTTRGSTLLRDLGRTWRRQMRFRIPVREAAFWQSPQASQMLHDSVQFLTGDDIVFEFVQANMQPRVDAYLDLGGDVPPLGFRPTEVILFSGGLDSLAGSIDALLVRRQQAVLVSHHSAPFVQAIQQTLATRLADLAGPGCHWHVSLALEPRGEAKERTKRSRAFLFAVLGAVVAHVFRLERVSFCENGIVSMNLPLADNIVGTRATRTTHPRVIGDLSSLLSLAAGARLELYNPLFWSTKADVVRQIASAGCASLIATTFSCAAVRETTMRSGQHCGACSQCLDRRFGVLAAGYGHHEPATKYAVDLFRGAREDAEQRITAKGYVLTAHRFAKVDLAGFLARYGEVFRALPWLGMPQREAAARLYDLHRRHGEAVVQVTAAAAAACEDPIAEALGLPDSCLLAMIRGPQARDIDVTPVNASEDVRPAKAGPISCTVDAAKRRILFDEGPVLSGAGAEVFLQLLPDAIGPLAAGPPRAAFTSTESLARKLGIDTDALRRRVERIRSGLARDFRAQSGRVLAASAIIENDRWRGYRLGKDLRFRAIPASSGEAS